MFFAGRFCGCGRLHRTRPLRRLAVECSSTTLADHAGEFGLQLQAVKLKTSSGWVLLSTTDRREGMFSCPIQIEPILWNHWIVALTSMHRLVGAKSFALSRSVVLTRSHAAAALDRAMPSQPPSWPARRRARCALPLLRQLPLTGLRSRPPPPRGFPQLGPP